MNIRGFVDTSFVDWDGKISSVVFTANCNLRCNYCYNFGLVLHPESFERIPEPYIFAYLEENRDFIDGVVITGGEPTLQDDLAVFCRRIKALGISIKLDTNGTQPERVEQLLKEKLVNYIAMDVKAPLNEIGYTAVAGVNMNGSLVDVKEAVKLIIQSGVDHEFRTTIVPGFHSKKDVENISKSLKGARRYFLQKFKPHTRFEELNKHPLQSDEEMEELARIARRHVKNAKWRGK